MPAARRSGSIARRCECRGADGKLLSQACPKLKRKNHGSYLVRLELPAAADSNKRRAFRRGGFTRVDDANDVLSRVQSILNLAGDDEADLVRVADFLAGLSASRADIPDIAEVQRRLGVGVPLDGKSTVEAWLDRWLMSKKTRANTTAGYSSHVRVHLKPRIGHIRLDRLSVGHLREMFDAIADEADVVAAENAARREQVERAKWHRPGRPPAKERERLAAERAKLEEMPPFRKVTGLGSRHAIRRTLRSALNAAIAEQLLTFNPARHVELDSYSRPKGLLWTDERVARWLATGFIPSPVMVWTLQQLGQFLDEAEAERLYSIFHVIAYHGLRRGEGVGSGWEDTFLDAEPPRIEVLKEIVLYDGTPTETAPKTDSSTAAVMLDSGTVAVLRERRRQQLAERDAWNEQAARLRAEGKEAHDWIDTGKIWTGLDGSWLHPDDVSAEFQRIRERAGLPPINLRDLRHVAAGIVKAGGGDIDDAKRKLRHSTIVLTSDTYMELFTEYEKDLTERSAAAVPRARKAAPEESLEEASGADEEGHLP
ncbi:site-specific integrase [Streptomyces showdoensis]|uniref:Integrase n=1 Tax=Streptomyces showdoensis TaxID=68268 RepID=A0A2P2GLB5_STREW|nr:tyrosine-type recombinase/integrase [Streptomyces showdoensis]KKZ72304.1 integrase [Streptomyces showdoensis]